MSRNKLLLTAASLLLAVLLSVELIWMGYGLDRGEDPTTPARETAEIIPEMVDASEKLEEPDENGEEPDEPEDKEEEEEQEPENQEKLISSEILKADTIEELPDKKKESEKDGQGNQDSDKKGDGQGDSGDGPESDPDKDKKDEPEKKDEGDKETKDLAIVTDLANFKTVEIGSLTDDILTFHASLLNAEEGTQLEVWFTPVGKGKRQITGSGDSFNASLVKCLKAGQVNRFSLLAKKNGKTLLTQDYTVRYINKQADEDTPDTGTGVNIQILSPVISADSPLETANQNLTVTIRAVSNESGKPVYADTISVWLDGVLQTNQPTGSAESGYEYQLYLNKPHSGDYKDNILTIRATDADNTANSSFIKRTIRFRPYEEGEVIGTAHVMIDASVLDFYGILDYDDGAIEIKQGQPASYAVKAVLDKYGIDVDFSGTLDTGFYIRGLNLDDCSGMEPDEILTALIEKDGLTRMPYSGPFLGEFDFTNGSGWMYSVGGTLYSGKGLSNYYPSDGDVIYLRYTLAYGKDIGGSSGQGNLTTYCTSWIDGNRIENHVAGQKEVKKEATCTEDGEESVTCSLCGKKMTSQPIPALGHDFGEISRREATTEEAGEIVYECSRCHDRKTEEIPILPPDVTPEPTQEPTPEPEIEATPTEGTGSDPEPVSEQG